MNSKEEGNFAETEEVADTEQSLTNAEQETKTNL